MNGDHEIAARSRQKLGCDEASAREALLQFDTNDGVFQVDEFVRCSAGLGLDISQARRSPEDRQTDRQF